MVLQETETMVQTVLSDTILTACRKTLTYHTEFSVEGMLHIVVDKKEVFLVNLKETIHKDEESSEDDKLAPETKENTPTSLTHSSAITRCRNKAEVKYFESDDEHDDNDLYDDSTDQETPPPPPTEKPRRRTRSKYKNALGENTSKQEDANLPDLSGVFPNIHSQISDPNEVPIKEEKEEFVVEDEKSCLYAEQGNHPAEHANETLEKLAMQLSAKDSQV